MATASPAPTPNPNAMRFSLDTTLATTVNVTNAEAAAGEPLAEALFAIDGVVSVYGTGDFLTVSRRPDADWDAIVPAVQEAVATHL